MTDVRASRLIDNKEFSEKTMNNNREQIGKNIIFVLLFFLLMANWNFHRLNVMMDKWNPLITAVFMSVSLVLICDIRELVKDKLIWLIVAINVVSFICMTIVGTGYYKIISLYCLTLGLYLATKLTLNKKDVLAIAIFMASFFFYWTFDVKGYFKGYSINYGGLVLISGFVFVAFLLEYVRYLILSEKFTGKVFGFIKEYPYIITAVEMFMFLWAYNIISWYRSRTAFFSLIVLAILMLIPRKVLGSKPLYYILVVGILLIGFIFPIAYVYVGSRVNVIDYQMFYKPLFSSRLPIWRDLFGIYKNYLLTGVGTIYTSNDIYRPGLLDTMNSYVDLLVVYGPIVCALVICLIITVLIKFREKVQNNQLTKMAFIAAIVMLVSSYAESSILSSPFTLIFILMICIARNADSNECFGEDKEYKAIDFNAYKKKYTNSEGLTAKGWKVLASALAVLLPIVLVLILGPVEVYYANYDEFSFTNYDYFWIYLALAFIILFIVTAVISVLPSSVNKIIVGLLAALSVASYVQYMFLNKKLIMEDGEFVEASALGNYPLITLCIYAVVFIVVCLIVFALRKKTYMVVSAITGFVIAITIVATLSLFLSHITSKKERLWYSGVDEFKVAKGDNVIVIVPDTFGREALDAMLKEYPDGIDFLNDFTFYENEDSLHFPTYPALHHMLTAYPYDDSMTRFEYTKAAFESDTSKEFFGELHENDYAVRLYTRDILFEQVTDGLVDNVEEAHITIDRKSLFKFMFRMSMYRYVPYVLKAPFQVDTMEIENINVYNGIGPYHFNSDFYTGMQEQGITIDDSIDKAFIMHHIRGTHMPYISNANNEMVPGNSVSGEECSYGTMRLIEEYLDRLKAIDKYDDSTVIVVADHGFYNTDSIFFIKKSGEKHDEMSVSDEKITHTDFQGIVLENIK